MTERKKVDPFDVEALERSLNDSATRVSTIWISFLVFSLYLLVAAATVSHRQLLLADPVRLPLLNIDLPLWGFFFLTPILFVVFHIYVLLQILLLGCTAATYNDAIDRAVKSPSSNAALRQRLANTLFAQIFAGSPRERRGWLGLLLTGMAWITLAIAPVLILLVFQFQFLPYHSHLAVWTQRLLVLIEIAAFISIWPLALDSSKDFAWPRAPLWRWQGGPPPIATDDAVKKAPPETERAIVIVASTACVLATFLVAFPGEPHVNLFTGRAQYSVNCERQIVPNDRLDLQRVDVVDDEKLARILQENLRRNKPDFEGERTRDLRDRDLNCSNLTSADLRGVDFSGTHLDGATLTSASMDGASLFNVDLRGAILLAAQMQGTAIVNSRLQGAILANAQLQGASLVTSEMQGTIMESSQMQGTRLDYVDLRGSSLKGAQLQGAQLTNLELVGASLVGVQLQGAELISSRLQGADLTDSATHSTTFSAVDIWRAKGVNCEFSIVEKQNSDRKIPIASALKEGPKSVDATKNNIEELIAISTAAIPDSVDPRLPPMITHRKQIASERLRTALLTDPANDDSAAISSSWDYCSEKTHRVTTEDFIIGKAKILRNLICGVQNPTLASSIVRNWISSKPDRLTFSNRLARGLLSLDGGNCASGPTLDGPTVQHLRMIVALANELGIQSEPASTEQDRSSTK